MNRLLRDPRADGCGRPGHVTGATGKEQTGNPLSKPRLAAAGWGNFYREIPSLFDLFAPACSF